MNYHLHCHKSIHKATSEEEGIMMGRKMFYFLFFGLQFPAYFKSGFLPVPQILFPPNFLLSIQPKP